MTTGSAQEDDHRSDWCCSLRAVRLLAADTIKKKRDSHTRTPGQVKVFSLVTGQTCGAYNAILKKVKNCRGITVEETNHWDQCDVIIIFCPISNRPGSNVQDAMSRVQGDSPVILVLMHHTRKPDHAPGETNWSETYPQVVLDVDVLFHDSVPGLLQCERNENTVQQIQRGLMERGGSQESGDVKKKRDSHTRTPGQVKVFSLVTGQTCGADEAILKKVKNCRGITMEETSHWDQCDVIIIFCPISSRPGSDVQDAMSRVQGDSPVILVLMHHTRKPDHTPVATNWSETYPQVVLDVNVLFHDSVPGLLQCERNENTVQQIHRELTE
ncbi:uncharacterized protein AKAME5_002035100 [Lates japonicus]|uniref:Uncharacterized protein n=1 Tax=Lates japonicus TaxID=270547 RepID=A0AAD3NB07_LATJO|nr:uncharacterized protein AKAME5_002035100 [Lates japonicus]